jgi:hypothetical protein
MAADQAELEVLKNMCDVLQDIRATLAASSTSGDERISSLTVEDMQKGPPKIISKSYDGRPLTRALVDQHLEAHAYAHREAERRAMSAWAETVAALEAARR